MALQVSSASPPNQLEDHGPLARALGPDDKVVTSLFLSPEDGVNERLLTADDVAGLRRLRGAEF